MIVFTGFSVGIFGAIIGSTLLVIVPLLNLLGMPIQVAIGTGKLSVIGRELIPLIHFRYRNLLSLGNTLPFSFSAMTTSFYGSMVAVELNEKILETIVAVFMFIIALIFLINPKIGLVNKCINYTVRHKIFSIIFGLLIGFYTGLFGGGANIFIIISFIVIFGDGFLKASANSKIPNMMITLVSLPVFILSGYVSWIVAIPLTISTAAGAHYGTKLAIKKGNKYIRSIFVILICVLAFKYLIFGVEIKKIAFFCFF